MDACGNPRIQLYWMNGSSLAWLRWVTFSNQKQNWKKDFFVLNVHFHCLMCWWELWLLCYLVLFMFGLPSGCGGLTVNVSWSARGGFLQKSSLSSPVAEPCQAHMSHIQLFRNVDLRAGAGLGSSVGVRARFGGGKGDVCVQLTRTKPSLSGLTLKSSEDLLAEREETLQTNLISACVVVWETEGDKTCRGSRGGLKSGLEGYMF